MLRVYAISQYLTDQQKQEALRRRYHWLPRKGGYRTAGGYCPLGAAIHLQLRNTYWSVIGKAPSPRGVVEALLPAGSEQEREVIRQAALEFMADWDAGLIPPEDLAAALGVSDIAQEGQPDA